MPHAHHAEASVLQEYLQPCAPLVETFDVQHLQIKQFLVCHLIAYDQRSFFTFVLPNAHRFAQEHLLPVAVVRGKSEGLVQPHLIQDRHEWLTLRHAHAAAHLL